MEVEIILSMIISQNINNVICNKKHIDNWLNLSIEGLSEFHSYKYSALPQTLGQFNIWKFVFFMICSLPVGFFSIYKHVNNARSPTFKFSVFFASQIEIWETAFQNCSHTYPIDKDMSLTF